MENLANERVVREICRRFGFSFSKALGQNFLINPSVCPRIAEMGGAKEANVLEIGPGFGVLTVELARIAKRVLTIEIDSAVLPVLDETLSGLDNVRVIHGDALKLDLRGLLEQEFHGEPAVVCANLPYYVTSPLIMTLLEQRLPVEAITVMVQKEAALRLCAQMGTRACGAVTAAVRYYSEPRVLFPVSRGSFLPPPKVDSCVIRPDLRQAPFPVADEAFLFRLIRAAFSQRRKTLANPVSAGLGLPKSTVTAALIELGISPSARAEELSLEQFAALSDRLGEAAHG